MDNDPGPVHGPVHMLMGKNGGEPRFFDAYARSGPF